MQTRDAMSPAPEPSTDIATRNPGLVEQVQVRRTELEAALAAGDLGASTRSDIESALATLGTMLTGDLDELPDTVRRDLARWLESNKYLGVRTGAPAETARHVADADGPSAHESDRELAQVPISQATEEKPASDAVSPAVTPPGSAGPRRTS